MSQYEIHIPLTSTKHHQQPPFTLLICTLANQPQLKFSYGFLHQLPLYCKENTLIAVKTHCNRNSEPNLFSPPRDDSRSTFLSLPRPHLLTSAAAAVVPKGTCHCWRMHSEDALEPCFPCQIPQMVDNQVWARDEDNQKNAFSKVCQSLGALASLQLKRLIIQNSASL